MSSAHLNTWLNESKHQFDIECKTYEPNQSNSYIYLYVYK